jgi:hypothetical protein
MKDLSVLIRSYNESGFAVNRLLNSLNRQEDIHLSEIVIFNDGNIIETVNAINNFISNNKHLNIKFIISDQNIGSGLALKELYKSSSRKYIIFCDMDDEYVINNGLLKCITLLKNKNYDFVNCDDGRYKLHQMTIFNKEKINEKLFVGFNYRDDVYMCYIYNYLNGYFYPYKFYNWIRKKNSGVHTLKHPNNTTSELWSIYSDLLNKRITKEVAILELQNIDDKNNIIYNNFLELLETNLF